MNFAGLLILGDLILQQPNVLLCKRREETQSEIKEGMLNEKMTYRHAMNKHL